MGRGAGEFGACDCRGTGTRPGGVKNGIYVRPDDGGNERIAANAVPARPRPGGKAAGGGTASAVAWYRRDGGTRAEGPAGRGDAVAGAAVTAARSIPPPCRART